MEVPPLLTKGNVKPVLGTKFTAMAILINACITKAKDKPTASKAPNALGLLNIIRNYLLIGTSIKTQDIATKTIYTELTIYYKIFKCMFEEDFKEIDILNRSCTKRQTKNSKTNDKNKCYDICIPPFIF